jgi:hypothetical protein
LKSGDYAYNSWGVKPMDENLIDLATFRIVTGIDLSDTLPEKDTFLDDNGKCEEKQNICVVWFFLFLYNDNKNLFHNTLGVPLSDWAQPRIMFPSSHSRQSLPNYQAAFRTQPFFFFSL